MHSAVLYLFHVERLQILTIKSQYCSVISSTSNLGFLFWHRHRHAIAKYENGTRDPKSSGKSLAAILVSTRIMVFVYPVSGLERSILRWWKKSKRLPSRDHFLLAIKPLIAGQKNTIITVNCQHENETSL
jgi:hypothetical protein